MWTAYDTWLRTLFGVVFFQWTDVCEKKSPSLLPSQLLGRSIWNLLFFFFLRQGFRCVTLLAVLEVALIDQVNLKLRDPPASVS